MRKREIEWRKGEIGSLEGGRERWVVWIEEERDRGFGGGKGEIGCLEEGRER